mgnify:CR=1 FL=1
MSTQSIRRDADESIFKPGGRAKPNYSRLRPDPGRDPGHAVLIDPHSAAVDLGHAFQLTANDYAKLITNSAIRNAFITTLGSSFLAALINSVFVYPGWVLVRYEFRGKTLLNGVIELPFALPTAVAGITLSKLYSDTGFFGSFFAGYGIPIAYTHIGLSSLGLRRHSLRRPLHSAGSGKLRSDV